jgi:hypothetical protein
MDLTGLLGIFGKSIASAIVRKIVDSTIQNAPGWLNCIHLICLGVIVQPL